MGQAESGSSSRCVDAIGCCNREGPPERVVKLSGTGNAANASETVASGTSADLGIPAPAGLEPSGVIVASVDELQPALTAHAQAAQPNHDSDKINYANGSSGHLPASCSQVAADGKVSTTPRADATVECLGATEQETLLTTGNKNKLLTGTSKMSSQLSFVSKRSVDSGVGAKFSSTASGKPFPKKPMFCRISKSTWDKIAELFSKLDVDGSNAVTREEAEAFFQGSFGKLSTTAMFNEVDVDGSGAITGEEFARFWTQVRSNGYSDQDICVEIEELLNGGTWVDWKDGRSTVTSGVRFPKRPLFCKLSAKLWKKCEELFRKINRSETMVISRDEATVFFSGHFASISTDAMFNEIDLDHHGTITAVDFMKFWVQVKKSGYSEASILEELDELMNGGAWVDWKDGRSTT